ncbi:anaphase-promoting complex subunit 15-like [Neocloeon triangulifer]|uniref:anaphase-promoting complex subunit 15-like n=1 Tax=Neocloeon triangulifer TaxID=2078957 RepID=UPI00286F1768|nr:anaphase-promoting complex subunit 15-like [Neocloeon triangulifer]
MELFPIELSLQPRLLDPLWFSVDRPCDEEAEIALMEQELQNSLDAIASKDNDSPVFGKNTSDPLEEMEDEDEEEDNDDEDSDSRGEDEEEEDLDLDHDHMDLTYEHADSPEET